MLTRAQICKKFKITSPTFDVIKGLLVAQPKSQHGNIFYKLNEKDALVLGCAKNHNESFRTATKGTSVLLPFHRFLCLRFLTTSLDDLMDEIRFRNLASHKLTKSVLTRMQGRFFRQLPKPLQTIARKKAPPSAKMTKTYDLMLQVLGIDTFYHEPMYLEGFFELIGDARIKQLVEAVFTTRGDKADHQKALEELAMYRWNDTAVDIYKSAFYDIYSMNENDWMHYWSFLKTSERKYKQRAREMTTAELKVQEGLKPHFREAMEMTAMNLQRMLKEAYDLGLSSDTKTLANLIGMFTKVGAASGEEMRAAVEDSGGSFETVSIIPAKRKHKTIDDVTSPGRVAKINA